VVLALGCSGGLGSDTSSSGTLGGGSGSTGSTGSSETDDQAESDGTEGDTASSGDTGSTTAVDPSETGEMPSCDANWRIERAEGTLADLAYDATSDVLYAVGSSIDGTGWAMAVDPCDGAVLADVDVAHAGSISTHLSSIVADRSGVFVGGRVVMPSNPGNGLYGQLDPTDLSTLWTASLFGSTDADEVLDLTTTASGRIWMAGTSGFDVAGTAWGISGSADGTACGFPWGGNGSGSVRALTREGEHVVMAIRTGEGKLVRARYDSSCTCMCDPLDASEPLEIGTADTSVGDVLSLGGQLYVVGWATDEDDPIDARAYLAWLNGVGAVVQTHEVDPTANGDGFVSIASDGDHLFVGGIRNWEGTDDFVGATAVLEGIPLPLAASPTPDWVITPADIDLILSVSVQDGPEGHVFAGGWSDATGVIVRCDKFGTCG
jgi:hypothetical protein